MWCAWDEDEDSLALQVLSLCDALHCNLMEVQCQLGFSSVRCTTMRCNHSSSETIDWIQSVVSGIQVRL